MNPTEQAIELQRLKDFTKQLEALEAKLATLQEQVRQLQAPPYPYADAEGRIT